MVEQQEQLAQQSSGEPQFVELTLGVTQHVRCRAIQIDGFADTFPCAVKFAFCDGCSPPPMIYPVPTSVRYGRNASAMGIHLFPALLFGGPIIG